MVSAIGQPAGLLAGRVRQLAVPLDHQTQPDVLPGGGRDVVRRGAELQRFLARRAVSHVGVPQGRAARRALRARGRRLHATVAGRAVVGRLRPSWRSGWRGDPRFSRAPPRNGTRTSRPDSSSTRWSVRCSWAAAWAQRGTIGSTSRSARCSAERPADSASSRPRGPRRRPAAITSTPDHHGEHRDHGGSHARASTGAGPQGPVAECGAAGMNPRSNRRVRARRAALCPRRRRCAVAPPGRGRADGDAGTRDPGISPCSLCALWLRSLSPYNVDHGSGAWIRQSSSTPTGCGAGASASWPTRRRSTARSATSSTAPRPPPDVTLAAVFGPQHGFRADLQDNMIETPHARDARRRVPVYSLYSETREPTAEMLAGLDVLVDRPPGRRRAHLHVRLHDGELPARGRAPRRAGHRLRSARTRSAATAVEGPMLLEPGYESFVGLFPIPMRHGMTIGELARLFNERFGIGAELEVVSLRRLAPRDVLGRDRPAVGDAVAQHADARHRHRLPGRRAVRGHAAVGRTRHDPAVRAARRAVDRRRAVRRAAERAGDRRGALPAGRLRADLPQARAARRAAASRSTSPTGATFRPVLAGRAPSWASSTAARPTGSPGASRRTSTCTTGCRSTSSPARIASVRPSRPTSRRARSRRMGAGTREFEEIRGGISSTNGSCEEDPRRAICCTLAALARSQSTT